MWSPSESCSAVSMRMYLTLKRIYGLFYLPSVHSTQQLGTCEVLHQSNTGGREGKDNALLQHVRARYSPRKFKRVYAIDAGRTSWRAAAEDSSVPPLVQKTIYQLLPESSRIPERGARGYLRQLPSKPRVAARNRWRRFLCRT